MAYRIGQMQVDAMIFISYSRANTEFARDLYNKLVVSGFKLWRDRSEMEAGRDWWQQIQEAIQESDTMVLVMSPQALASSTVAKEWRYARQVGTRVIPVVAEDIDFKVVPRWMARMDWLDFREDALEHDLIWTKFLHQLRTPYQRVRMPFTVPDLPEHFVKRPGVSDALLKLLLDTDRENRAQITTVLQGGGGFGKTTLAQEICYHEDILHAFSDGILWMSLGEQPDVLGLLLDQIEYLSGTRPGFTDITLATKRLDDLLTDRELLIVLDDVWNEVHVRPFISAGKHCAHLLTTRRQDIAVSVTVQTITVNEMQLSEASQLLIKWLKASPADLRPFEALAHELGEWPLLLALAGAYLYEAIKVDKQPLDDALAGLRRRLVRRGFTAFDRTDERQRNRAISISLEVSLERLGKWRERYCELAIFPPDIKVPFKTVEQLWSATAKLDDVDTEDALKAMNRLSLFMDYDASQKTLRLHDVIHVYLGSQLSDVSTVHAKLVEQWGDPYKLPDQYSWHWYIYHLREAKRYSDVLRLVDKPFLEAKVQYCKSHVAINEDIRVALSVAEATNDNIKMLGLALVYNCLQSRIVQLSNADVIPLYARFGEADRALEFAKTIQDANRQATTLVKIAEELLSSNRQRARQIIREVLAQWRQYEPGYICGLILRHTFDIFPEELISFLETVEDLSPVYSLGESGYPAYDAIDSIGLEPELKLRLINALTSILPLAKSEHSKQELRLLLARYIDDPDIAASFADNEVATVIVAAKYDRLKQADRQLSKETVNRALNIFFMPSATVSEQDTLFRYVIGPNFADFAAAIDAMTMPLQDLKIRSFLDLIVNLAKRGERVGEASSLMLKLLEINSKLPYNKGAIRPGYDPGGFRIARELIVEGLAASNLETALKFLNSPLVAAVLDESDAKHLLVRAIAAAAKVNPHDALRVANSLQDLSQKQRAKAFVAEGLAYSDLAQALSIWHELKIRDTNKQDILIKILKNAPPRDYPHAQMILATEFRPELAYQVYKIPVLLEVATRLSHLGPDSTLSIAKRALSILYRRIDEESQRKAHKEFFLINLVRPLVLCGLIGRATAVSHSFSDDYGLRGIAAAEILETISQDSISIDETNVDEYTLPMSYNVPLLLRQASEDTIHGSNIGGISDSILEFAEHLIKVNSNRLINLYLLYGPRNQAMESVPDYVKAIIAPKIARYAPDGALELTKKIKDTRIQYLTRVDLLDVLPSEAVPDRKELGDKELLLAIADVRLVTRQLNTGERRETLERAFASAERGIAGPSDWFDLCLLIQFVCEARQLDAEMALRFARRVIETILASTQQRTAHLLYYLRRADYVFNDQEITLINRKSNEWVARMKEWPNAIAKTEAYRLMSEELSFMAQATLPVDFDTGMQFIDMANHYSSLSLNSVVKQELQGRILKSLLFSRKLEAWRKAVVYSTGYGGALFDTFEWFGYSLLEIESENPTLPSQLLNTLDWAENLIKL